MPRKNVRSFAGTPGGLLAIKLEQLVACESIDQIILSSNDEVAIGIAQSWLENAGGRLRIDRRPEHLCSSTASTDELIAYVASIVAQGDLLWTHVTSPFFGTDDYSTAIETYRAARDARTHDSLMGVTLLQTHLWGRSGRLNFSRSNEKWPPTQALEPIYDVNSSVFIAPIDVYRVASDRIGTRPIMHVIPKIKAIDIDREEDFLLAEELWRLRHSMGVPGEELKIA